MKEILTDYWSLLLPEEWFADQDAETIVISDNDEVSVIEITTLLPDGDLGIEALYEQVIPESGKVVDLADLKALFHEFDEDDMFWREWFCKLDDAVLIVSHGTDIENRNFDDSAVDEILSTLLIGKAD